MNIQPYAVNQSQIIGTYQPEQILKGKISEVLPDRRAIIDIGEKRMVAKVDTEIKIGNEYLFQVKQNKDPHILHVIGGSASLNNEKSDQKMVSDLLRAFHLRNNQKMRQIVHFFLNQQALSKSFLETVYSLLPKKSTLNDLKTIQFMNNRKIPLEASFFQALKYSGSEHYGIETVKNIIALIDQETSQSTSMEHFRGVFNTLLDSNKNRISDDQFFKEIKQPEHLEIKRYLLQSFFKNKGNQDVISHFLSNLGKKPTILIDHLSDFIKEQLNTEEIKELKQYMLSNGGLKNYDTVSIIQQLKLLGLHHEHDLCQSLLSEEKMILNDSLKEGALRLIQDHETPSVIKRQANELLQNITGQQIQLISSDPALLQFVTQLPWPSHGQIETIKVYWEGKRQGKGLDADDCRIILSLKLETLKETLVHIRIQHRSLTIQVQNDDPLIKGYLKQYESGLKERLQKLNYQLVSLTAIEHIDSYLKEKVDHHLPPSDYKMDVKI
ncbi:hypothetical protein [Terrilactibacillus laevilacticus]|uniref:Flagellar hook-length control protein FliK n=1 Tax=Terrilactibacillus laevilacticus TaxID=1380157 RepID=A0ABW5PPU8_9BACI|nr:hypothetical protein [Terrilactibacillus laevilacticus]